MRYLRILIFGVLASILILPTESFSQPFKFSRSGGYQKSATVTWAKRKKVGYNMRFWMSNELQFGVNAATTIDDIGFDYPAGANNEHFYGGGIIIGGIVNGQKRVSSAYWETTQEFVPNIADTARDRLWMTSSSDTVYDASRFGYYKRPGSQKAYDDDGDGRVDEDELDGLDNDGDWNIAADDIGADGIPDSLETGCRGPFNASTNRDPAFDNYSPGSFDYCRTNSQGVSPRMNNRDAYTENNSIPDHGEPHVDEDFRAISDQDIYCTANDTFTTPTYGQLPVGVKVWQKVYTWEGQPADAFVPVEYKFVNVSRFVIESAYLGFIADLDVGPVSSPAYVTHDYAGYYPEIQTIYIHNAIDRGATPMGVAILGASKPLEDLNYTFRWFNGGETVNDDLRQYDWLTCEAFGSVCRQPDQPSTQTNDARVFLGFGSFGDVMPGDTVTVTIAFVSGDRLEKGDNNMVDNVKKAKSFYQTGYRKPITPVSPCLTLEPGFKNVTVRWGRDVLCDNGRRAIDPFSIWDDDNSIADQLPSDHWRRINPPAGHTRGGRIFEGFRLYRSEDPNGTLSSFTLLKQFDLDDEFSYNSGFDTVFVDTNLTRGKRYWYTVTAFGIPDRVVLPIRDGATGNIIRYDTVYTEGTESPIISARDSIDLPFDTSTKPGEVLVVPNPYRVDHEYTYESGGWEGRARDWSENDRKVKFIHLPGKCTVRIFTLTGDVVATLEHDDPNRGELDWNLLSNSNRALASGVYIFTVESDLGRQIGKFALIR